jgi:endonuclease G
MLVLVAIVMTACGPHPGGAGAPAVAARAPATEVGDARARPPLSVAGSIRSPHLQLGTPIDADESDDLLLDHGQYVSSYNPIRHVPNWVAWRLSGDDLGQADRRDDFRPDPDLPLGVFRATPRDYLRSGYDRGHLCPSADRTRSAEANATTFLMTNIQPQVHELNAGPWERLAVYARTLARSNDLVLYIVAGGLFGAHPTLIGHALAVPDFSYKIVCAVQRGQSVTELSVNTKVLAVKMPNQHSIAGHAWTEYLVSVDELERESGYDFMPGIPEPLQELLESQAAGANSLPVN